MINKVLLSVMNLPLPFFFCTSPFGSLNLSDFKSRPCMLLLGSEGSRIPSSTVDLMKETKGENSVQFSVQNR